MQFKSVIFSLWFTSTIWCQSSPALAFDLFKTRYKVKALVINESNEPVVVALLNNGPHGGGCDDKNYVVFTIDSKRMETVSEDWWCGMPQNFAVMIRSSDDQWQFDGSDIKLLCTADGCRPLDVHN